MFDKRLLVVAALFLGGADVRAVDDRLAVQPSPPTERSTTAPAAKPAAAPAPPVNPEEQPTVIKLAITPAAEVQPALKYQLLPKYLERRPGNAAQSYYRAIVLLKQVKDVDTLHKKVSDLLDKPFAEFPLKEAEELLKPFANVLGEVDLAALHQQCQWELNLSERESIFAVLLPEMQEMRNIARLLSLRARVQMREKKYDEAVRTFRTGYVMSRHCAEMPFLISALVGIASASMISEQVQQFSTLPGSPNLYWALSTLPRPLIDLRPAWDLESATIELEFPILRTIHEQRSPEEWDRQLHELMKKITVMYPLMDNNNKITPWGNMASTSVLTTWIMLQAPQARERLKKLGFPEREVTQMPASQAVLVYTAREFQTQRDDMFRWFHTPYTESRLHMEREEVRFKNRRPLEILPIARMLLPALSRVMSSTARMDRRIIELRVLEALRHYAATHEGQLPQKLADIEDYPVPLDPLTGESVRYELQQDKAVVSFLPPQVKENQRLGRVYHITVAR